MKSTAKHPAIRATKTAGSALSGTPVVYLAENGFVGDSIVDGPGLRCTLFVQGCPHNCPGCHNPATHPFAGGKPHTCAELLEKVKSFPLCRAVTLSGGEPFCQAEALSALAALLRAEGYAVAAYTGYTFEALQSGTTAQQALLAQLDTLIDGPYIEPLRSLDLRFRGSRNQRIINIKNSLAEGRAVCETEPRWVGNAPPAGLA